MLHSRNIGRRTIAFSIVSGTVGLAAYIALIPANFNESSAKAEVAAISLGSLAPALAASPPPGESAAANTCNTQNWPFYSNDCLRGDHLTMPMRQVHLEPVSAKLFAAPDIVGQAEMTRKKSLPRQHTERPRRNVREATHHVRRKPRSVQSQVAETRASEFFSW